MDLPVDQDIRDRCLSPGLSFHLQAPAGSGKTSVLLARFLTLLARVEAPEELLALTFTRKAAGELRSRLMQLLWQQRDPGPGAEPWERRLTTLADKVWRHFSRKAIAPQEFLTAERLPIMTFHSFCAQLLRVAPQEAGLPPDFQLLENDEAEWLKQEALEELRRRLGARPPQDPVRLALVRRLLRLNNNWPRLAWELRALLARRDTLGDFLHLAKHIRQPGAYEELLTQRYQVLLKPLLQSLKDGLAPSDLGRDWPDFCEALQGSPRGEGLPPVLPGAAPEDLPRWQAVAQVLLTGQGEFRKQLSPNYGFPAGLQKTGWPGVIQALPQSLAPLLRDCLKLTVTAFMPEEAAALQDLVILLGETLTLYEELCAQRRSLDFIALEQAALGLLKTEAPSDLMLRLDLRLRHLLVDEFQDTSEAQTELLCQLLSGWSEGGRTLMVVGDPMQSIYEWRQAKVRLFLESRQGLSCADAGTFPLEPLALRTNFRSTRTLITWANQVFGETVMEAAPGLAGISFHAAWPGPDAASGEAPRLALFWGDEDATARQAEARWLARQVAQAVGTLKVGEKIGILLFTRTHLTTYLQALNEAALAPVVREGLKLADSLAVQHLHNLARALVRPQDEVAWAALLRAPWARQTLKTLTQVAQTPGAVWPKKLRRFIGETACAPDLAKLATLLEAAANQVGRRPLAEILHDWLDAMDAWSGLAFREGPAGVANARAYLELLAEAEAGLPEATFQKADFNLEGAYQPPDPRAQDSPVEVLTVHGAKGLEFQQVFLPYLDWQPLKGEPQAPPFLLEEIPQTRLYGLALARPYAQGKQSSLYSLLKNLKERRVLAEARRVFYVAVTRAQERLVLSGIMKRDAKGHLRPPAMSPLGWLWQHYRPSPLVSGVPVVWPEPEIRVELFTHIPALTVVERQSQDLPEPWEVYRQAEPYRREFPSQLQERGSEAGPPSGAEDLSEAARLRGEVTHRLLETLSRGGDLPGAASVAAALRQAGMAPAEALGLAPEILAEVAACRKDRFLASLLRPDLTEAASEWLLEDRPSPDTLRRGQIDRLAFDGKTWWLLDYKTSRPQAEEDWEPFMARETEKYRPQLLAYREMAARAKGLDPSAIRLVLYFTGCRQKVVI